MNKSAIVTGGAKGIGKAITLRLAREGYRIAILGRSPLEESGDLQEQLEAQGAQYIYVQGDLANHQDREKLVQTAVEQFGSLDLLVNNAGIAPKKRVDLLEMSEESYDCVLNVNLKGTMFLTQLVAKQMLEQQERDGVRGVIINVSSVSAEFSSLNRGEYCISKAGVSMLTLLYADRLAGDGILVYEIRPGVIDTTLVSPEAREKYDKMIASGSFPINRWGKPEDIADAVAQFASGEMRYTTGQVIYVDGGYNLRRL